MSVVFSPASCCFLLAYLATADIGVASDPSNDLNDKLTMIKILEYMAYSLPVVIFDVTEGRRSAGDAAVYARSNDTIDFGDQIAELLDSPLLRRRLGAVGRNRIEGGLNWAHQKQIFLRAYQAALGPCMLPLTLIFLAVTCSLVSPL